MFWLILIAWIFVGAYWFGKGAKPLVESPDLTHGIFAVIIGGPLVWTVLAWWFLLRIWRGKRYCE